MSIIGTPSLNLNVSVVFPLVVVVQCRVLGGILHFCTVVVLLSLFWTVRPQNLQQIRLVVNCSNDRHKLVAHKCPCCFCSCFCCVMQDLGRDFFHFCTVTILSSLFRIVRSQNLQQIRLVVNYSNNRHNLVAHKCPCCFSPCFCCAMQDLGRDFYISAL
jgi:hypothetical protein